MENLDAIINDRGSCICTWCRELSGQTFPDLLSIQIERVLRHLLDDDDLRQIAGTEGIVAAFRSRGLIPPSLVESLKQYPQPEALAVCFAACIYPSRAYALQEQLPPRLASFLTALQSADIYDLLGTHQLRGMSPEEIRQLLGDLSAADFVVGREDVATERIREERRLGAALFLVTWQAEDVETILRNWRDEMALVRFIRNVLPSSPSNICYSLSGRAGDWVTVEEKLTGRGNVGSTKSDEPSRTVMLERHVRRKIRSLSGNQLSNALISQMVADCWETHWAKLISGFPYYSFRSRFGWWWRMCVSRWIGSFIDNQHGSLGPQPPGGPPRRHVLTPDELRVFREGYRLVRTTFFDRKDPNRTEAVRSVVDDLWYRRLERKMTAEDEPDMVKDIAWRHQSQGVTKDGVNNYSHRLRLRIWAHTLARQKRWSNQQILGAKLPTEKEAAEYPFQDRTNQAGVLTIACLARIAHEDQTLLWPFTAHRVLHPLIEPQHFDAWSFSSYLPEVWRWITAGSLDVILNAGHNRWNRVDLAATIELNRQPLEELREKLAQLESDEEVRSFTTGRGHNLVAEAERAACNCCLSLVTAKLLPRSVAGRMKDLKPVAEHHWVVPVWYLAAVEGLGAEQVITRLRVEPCDQEKVLRLFRQVMKQ